MMFMHKDAAWPGVVIEVSHSQKKSLVDLADNYILGRMVALAWSSAWI
jgi:hypothetical protein